MRVSVDARVFGEGGSLESANDISIRDDASLPTCAAREVHHALPEPPQYSCCVPPGRTDVLSSALPMLTTAITAAITGILSFFGIPPGPYIAGIWIGVKVLVVATIALIAWRTARKAKAKQALLLNPVNPVNPGQAAAPPGPPGGL